MQVKIRVGDWTIHTNDKLVGTDEYPWEYRMVYEDATDWVTIDPEAQGNQPFEMTCKYGTARIVLSDIRESERDDYKYTLCALRVTLIPKDVGPTPDAGPYSITYYDYDQNRILTSYGDRLERDVYTDSDLTIRFRDYRTVLEYMKSYPKNDIFTGEYYEYKTFYVQLITPGKPFNIYDKIPDVESADYQFLYWKGNIYVEDTGFTDFIFSPGQKDVILKTEPTTQQYIRSELRRYTHRPLRTRDNKKLLRSDSTGNILRDS